jgi:glycine betaine transporter
VSTDRDTDSQSVVERVFLGSCLLTGTLVLIGFFFQGTVEDLLGGQYWLALSLLFFGSGLGYLAVLPYRRESVSLREPVAAFRLRMTSQESTVRSVLVHIDPLVALPPVVLFGSYLGCAMIIPAATAATVESVTTVILELTGPMFQIVILLALVSSLILAFSKWGDLRLGGADATPAYSYATYFTLIFTAGIAAGIVFWGPTEALFHYRNPPAGLSVSPQTTAAAETGLATTLFHWGISAWSAYAIIGVPIAYAVYERGAPLRFSALLTPIVGLDAMERRPTRLIDSVAVLATIGGIATSVALLSEQFLTGIAFQWGIRYSREGVVLFILGLAVVYGLSAASGLHRGVRRIAALNILLFGLFALTAGIVGPTEAIIQSVGPTVAGYVTHFIPLSFGPASEWTTEWTIWNWAWWFSWAPFAGMFIAALSRGRRLRTVVLTTVGATSLATAGWFLILGQISLTVQQAGTRDLLAVVATRGGQEAVVGFSLLSTLPVADFLIFVFLALIVVFMITSADTSTLVTAFLITRRGTTPSQPAIFLWAGVQACVALGVTVFGGASALQALAVLAGAPVAGLAVFAIGGLFMSLKTQTHPSHYTPLWKKITNRLPHIQAHHDIDPPDDEFD